MGNCASSSNPAASAVSNGIDRQIERDAVEFRKECKILLLGSGESGKSTIVKQMKIIHQDGFSNPELARYTHVVYRNLIESAQDIVRGMVALGLAPADPTNRAWMEMVLDYRIPPDMSFTPLPELFTAISALLQDPVLPQVFEHASEFDLMDNAPYFFSQVGRISKSSYCPSENDILRTRQKSIGITETKFNMGRLNIHMCDVGGQRSERKKWIHCFENVTTVIFCTALSEYDQMLREDPNQNRMTESLTLFESVINSRWFLRASFILFLNKTDVFKAKVPKVPLSHYFPEYQGGKDINKAAKFILWKFMQTNRAGLPVHQHLTQATDTGNIRLVFSVVKETILQNALKDTGIL